MQNDHAGFMFHPAPEAKVKGSADLRSGEYRGDYAVLGLEIGGLHLTIFPADAAQTVALGKLLSRLGAKLTRLGNGLQPEAEG